MEVGQRACPFTRSRLDALLPHVGVAVLRCRHDLVCQRCPVNRGDQFVVLSGGLTTTVSEYLLDPCMEWMLDIVNQSSRSPSL